MDNRIDFRCRECKSPTVTFNQLLGEILLTVDCVICGGESSILLDDLLSGTTAPTCCEMLLFPNIWADQDLVLTPLCGKCITQNVILVDDAYDELCCGQSVTPLYMN